MTTYFAAPDGFGEPTLWAANPVREDLPYAVLRRTDLTRGQKHRWDELVARVIAGNEHEHDWRSPLTPSGIAECRVCGAVE